MNKAWYIALAVVVVVGAFFLFASEGAPNGNSDMLTVPSDEISGAVGSVGVHTVRITANGFEPASLIIKKGDIVTWVNESGRNVWPASAMHPTHKVYPGSDISKCGSAEAANIFDSCQGISTGGSWSFIFNEVGTWKYHDHLRATVFGSVAVE
ncbi:MAG: hypothetical protein V1885_01475 [Candidatus Brennerbacteria bacterium]